MLFRSPAAQERSAPAVQSSPAAAALREPLAETGPKAHADDWRGMLAQMGLSGMVRTLAQHCELVARRGNEVVLRLAPAHRHLLVGAAQEKLQKALADAAGAAVRLRIDVEQTLAATPAALDQRERQDRQDQAVAAIESDSLVREVIDMFDATIVESTIKPIVQEK